jgi:hypothetical protein
MRVLNVFQQNRCNAGKIIKKKLQPNIREQCSGQRSQFGPQPDYTDMLRGIPEEQLYSALKQSLPFPSKSFTIHHSDSVS